MQTTQSSTHTSEARQPDYSRIAQDLQIRKAQVESVVELLDEGNTIPFITRYRKERTGGLDEEVLRKIQRRVQQQRQLSDRKQSILKSIQAQGHLTDELRRAIQNAETNKRLDDLYLPYKPKKRTLATIAREKGLGPVADAVWASDPAVENLQEICTALISAEKELNTADDVRAGIQHILAEKISETVEVRAALRFMLWDHAKLCSNKNEKLKQGAGLDFKDYFEHSEDIRTIPPHRILAINRGEKERALSVKLDIDKDKLKELAWKKLTVEYHPHKEFLKEVAEDAITRLIFPSLEREIRKELTTIAEEHAVSVFACNLRNLLLAPPLEGKRVLAIDPGFRTGCKLAAIDETGNLLDHGVIYPHPPQKKSFAARQELEEFIRKHQLNVIAIGNGTACRETEELVSDLLSDLKERNWQGEPTPPPPPPVEEKKEEVVESTPVASEESVSEESTTEEATPPVEDQPVAEAPVTESTESTTPEPQQESVQQEQTEQAEVPTPPKEEEATQTEEIPEKKEQTEKAESSPTEKVKKKAPEKQFALAELPPAPSVLAYTIVAESGASVYSASPIAREEFPEFDATLRGTISIGRRLQDPLSELVKIDPQNIGVGLYQHDVAPKFLKESLEGVVESCVNTVGVDLNTASVPLLKNISGLNQMVAHDLVEHRKANGPFKAREQLTEVNGIGQNRFTQAAGFLKIRGGEEPLDQTWIHPESYEQTRQLLTELGFGPEALNDKEKVTELRDKLKSINLKETAEKLELGEPTLRDIIDSLSKPGRDPREDAPPPVFRTGILKLEDLTEGMELQGTVLNVVDFGAFVDIGLKDSGLVHISQLANRFIKNPYDIVAVGDTVTVWVMGVDMERNRVSLSMIKPGTPRETREPRPRREQRQPRDQQKEREPRKEGDRPPRGRRSGPRQDRGARKDQGQTSTLPRRGERRIGDKSSTARKPKATEEVVAQEQKQQSATTSPPPRRRRTPPKPKPKLNKEQLAGESSLGTFAELAAFWGARDEDEPQKESSSEEKQEQTEQ